MQTQRVEYDFNRSPPPEATLDLFERRIPHRPYATDHLGPGLRRMSPQQALRHRHLEVNPPSVRFWLLFDIDQPMGAMSWDFAGLPEPAWTAQNTSNGHAHVAWGLEAPVLLDKPARQKPVRYLAAVESAYRAAMDADPSYGGLLTKNPLSPHWRTYWGQYGIYGLDELAEYVDLERHKPRRGVDPEEVGLGRNVALFDWLRLWAYQSVRHYKAQGPRMEPWFEKACADAAQHRNGDFPNPLHEVEVHHTAKSVARWVWKRFSLEGFKRVQSARGRKGGVASGESKKNRSQRLTEAHRGTIESMLRDGYSQKAIGAHIGVTQQTISNWIKRLGLTHTDKAHK